jgi:hypothetical protein
VIGKGCFKKYVDVYILAEEDGDEIKTASLF